MELKNKLLLVVMIMFSLVVGCRKKTVNYGPPSPRKAVTNSIGMNLVYIHLGDFMMGSPDSEKDRFNHEGPQHKVKISRGLWMGIYEVTQAQYQSVMGTNPSCFKGDNLPVETVSWDDAVEFCRRLSQKEDKTYRLPTEAEWEYACRAGTTTRFYYGDDLDESKLGEYAWYGSNSDGKTHPVGQKKSNAFGLYDMHGNVWEWCQDWYDEKYYSNKPEVDPPGPASGQYRVLRGGNWSGNALDCRVADRVNDSLSSRDNGIGFRVVLDLN
jgi:formylglycine-generating enzyme required for sulfatase activity